MITVSKYKAHVQSKFEGGATLKVDWYENIQEAANLLLTNITPPSSRKVIPVFGGIVDKTAMYYCPYDVFSPISLYKNDKIDTVNTERERLYFVPEFVFDKDIRHDAFTITFRNGVRYLKFRSNEKSNNTILDKADSATGFSGVSLQVNDYDAIYGDTSLEGTFTSTNNSIEKTLTETINISEFLRGIVLLPMRIVNSNVITSINLYLYSDDSNYRKLSTTRDVTGSYISFGWNILRFSINNAEIVGNPTNSIQKFKIEIEQEDGASQIILIGESSFVQSIKYNLDYYSDRIFIDSETGEWVDSVKRDEDYVNLDKDAFAILVLEGARIVAYGATRDKARTMEDKAFEVELQRKYKEYWAKYPSEQTPLTYNMQSDLDNGQSYITE